MKRVLGATGIFAICAGSVSVYAGDVTVSSHDVGRSLVSETTYSVRSSYKWADEASESLAYIAHASDNDAIESNSYKWDDAAPGAASKSSSGELASAREKSFQAAYKWGIKSDADQSAYKWGIKSAANQSAYKWGIK